MSTSATSTGICFSPDDLCMPVVDIFTNYPAPAPPAILPPLLSLMGGDDVISLSYGLDTQLGGEISTGSAGAGSLGVAGSPPDLASEAAGFGEVGADIFVAGTTTAPAPNKLAVDADGMPFSALPGPPATGLLDGSALAGVPPFDDLDAFSSCDPLHAANLGVGVFFTLAPGSPTLALFGASSADIFVSGPLGGFTPSPHKSAATMGLSAADVIDALAYDFYGTGTAFFSLAASSPSLTTLYTGCLSGTLQVVGPEDAFYTGFGGSACVLDTPAAVKLSTIYGFAPGDELDALDARPDADADFVNDSCDNCLGLANNEQKDGDLDLVGDPCDNCPATANTGQADSDADSVGDACDNCPALFNPGQADTDSDTVGDACDICAGFDDLLDGDGDGVPDGCDPCPLDAADDSDGDGVCDSDDVCPGFDDTIDADSDTVPDGCDICAGFDDTIDTDSDGVPDGCDVCPLDNPDDSDGDGVCDTDDVCPGFDDTIDADSDTVPDGCDLCAGFDDTLDADGDGNPDGCDTCTNVAGGQDVTIKPRVILKKVNTDTTPGDEKLTAKGEFVLAGGTSFAMLDPASDGVRIVISTTAGAVISDDAVLGGVAWSTNNKGNVWKYKDKAGTTNGISKIQVKDRSNKSTNQVLFKVNAKDGTFPVLAGDEPVQLTIVLGGAASSSNGECGETVFSAGDCGFNGSGKTLKCSQ